ncbi:serine hydrolase [Staphylococcus sp. 17KM0847]|uniref:serine hydrolase n=1 Tax=Staphylococcus sp. 17KM0847 TaxID=2583989 RepID=UPI0015DCBAB1|nr:serine hydrolase [Staphylococcus sp. 17KM0847]QLK85671.1 hypothetical protein FGL66_02565 [Staphylococcus sp. 17KM0847]
MMQQSVIPQFVEKMNEKAKSIGMHHSTFKNPSGLTARGQLSTSYDLSLLTLHASFNHNIVRIWKKKQYSIKIKGDNNREINIKTTVNDKVQYKHYRILGGKTGTIGFIKNLSVLVYDNEHIYIVTLLKVKGNRFYQAKQIIDHITNPEHSSVIDAHTYTVFKYPLYNPILFTQLMPTSLISKNEHARNNPASITKLLTLLVAFDYPIDLEDNIKITDKDIVEDSLNDIRSGDIIKLDDALHLMLLSSSNILANALSRHVFENYML